MFRNTNDPKTRPSVTNSRVRPAITESRIEASSSALAHMVDAVEDAVTLGTDQVAPFGDADVQESTDDNDALLGIIHGKHRPQTHIFDGLRVENESARYQLCDITDPLLKKLIEDENVVRGTCDVRIILSLIVRLTHAQSLFLRNTMAGILLVQLIKSGSCYDTSFSPSSRGMCQQNPSVSPFSSPFGQEHMNQPQYGATDTKRDQVNTTCALVGQMLPPRTN